jgi:uncharacterized membrane protein SpoIIM required for sporulation/ABC-type transport system involved in multi-copper enzyme maturation permease subunit
MRLDWRKGLKMAALHKALHPALIIARREVRDQFRDWRIIFPVVGLTLVFPFIMNWTAERMFTFVNEYGATLIASRLVPFLLMVVGFFPISVSLVIALETFVGERERGSIEPLLNSPLQDWQIYLGKLISATIPPLLSSLLGMGVYLTGLAINGIPWPEPVILVQIVLLTIVQAVMMVSGAVVVSSQATSVRAANLLSSFIVIPSAFLIQWEALVMFWGDINTLWWVVAGVLVLTILLVRVGLAHFQREELLGREIDVLRIRYSLGLFWRSFTGGARSPRAWYRTVLPVTLRRLALPSLLIFGVVIAGVIIGWNQVDRFPLLFDPELFRDYNSNIRATLEVFQMASVGSVLAIFWQNLRVLLLALLLGIFSFGVVGVFPLMVTMCIAGYLLGILSLNGIPALPLVTGLLLPHGIIEIPAAILATASVLDVGAVLATPTPGRTVGEVWLVALADWARVMVGVVIPLLVVASVIEVWITPRIALLVFGG